MKRVAAAILAALLIFMASGCVVKKDTNLYNSKGGDWSIEIPDMFVMDKEEAQQQANTNTVYFKTGSEFSLTISEAVDKNLVISEDLMKRELEDVKYFKVEKYETTEIKGVGNAYSALIKDQMTGTEMLYYWLKYNDKSISFIFYNGSFSEEQIKMTKTMLRSFKGLK